MVNFFLIILPISLNCPHFLYLINSLKNYPFELFFRKFVNFLFFGVYYQNVIVFLCYLVFSHSLCPYIGIYASIIFIKQILQLRKQISTDDVCLGGGWIWYIDFDSRWMLQYSIRVISLAIINIDDVCRYLNGIGYQSYSNCITSKDKLPQAGLVSRKLQTWCNWLQVWGIYQFFRSCKCRVFWKGPLGCGTAYLVLEWGVCQCLRTSLGLGYIVDSDRTPIRV